MLLLKDNTLYKNITRVSLCRVLGTGARGGVPGHGSRAVK